MRQLNSLLPTFGLVFLVIFAACNQFSGPSPVIVQTPEVSVDQPGSGLCQHPYFPVVLGSSRSYVVTFPDNSSAESKETITEIDTAAFAISIEENDQSFVQNVDCTLHGFVFFIFDGGPSIAFEANGYNARVRTANVSGVTLPTEIKPGDSWSQSFGLNGEFAPLNESQGMVTGSALCDYTAISIETISTLAGTYNALRIESNCGWYLRAQMPDGTMRTVSRSYEFTNWFVEQLGLAKAEETTILPDGSRYTVQWELESYSFP